jgi:hypothetical protein
LAAYLRLRAGAVRTLIEQESGLLKTLPIAFVCQICLHCSDLYDDPRM